MPKVKLSKEEISLMRWWVEVEMSLDETDDEFFKELKDLDKRLAHKEKK